MKEKKCDIGTLASKLKSNDEIKDQNIVKAVVKDEISSNKFSEAKDFLRKGDDLNDNLYHHMKEKSMIDCGRNMKEVRLQFV